MDLQIFSCGEQSYSISQTQLPLPRPVINKRTGIREHPVRIVTRFLQCVRHLPTRISGIYRYFPIVNTFTLRQ